MTDARSEWYCIMWSSGLRRWSQNWDFGRFKCLILHHVVEWRHWSQNWDFGRLKCVVLYHVVEWFKTLVSELGLLEV